jgi:hypothetical protein
MTPAFLHLLTSAHSLQKHRRDAVPPVASPGGKVMPDPEAAIASMVRHYPVASSGERIMISAALSLIPKPWLEEVYEDIGVNHPSTPLPLPVPAELRLSGIGSLDAGNTRALIEAIAIVAGHPEVLRWPVSS